MSQPQPPSGGTNSYLLGSSSVGFGPLACIATENRAIYTILSANFKKIREDIDRLNFQFKIDVTEKNYKKMGVLPFQFFF